jgi:putative ABC transport system substrate-binding protein
MWRIGFLLQRHAELSDADYAYGALVQGLREFGYIEGKNVSIELRSAEGRSERLPDLAQELARLNVDVIVTGGTPAAFAAVRSTAVIPIVMISVGDPVALGLAKSLARPGGNRTGISNMGAELGPKFLEMLRAMVPKVTRVSVLVNSSNAANKSGLKDIQAAAQKVGVSIFPTEASSADGIATAFSEMARQKTGALIVTLDAFFIQQKRQIADLTEKHRLPSASANIEFVEAGGLMSFGPNIRDLYRRAARYVDKIHKGTSPGEIPIEQPTLFELVVNLKTARSLGIKVPQSILVQATKVIE